MSKKRDRRLDVLRGLLMMLVVLGHCIQYVANPTDFDHNFIFRAIYSFHMPAFRFLSGYVAQLISDTKIREYSHRGQEADFFYQLPEKGDEAVLTVPIYDYPGYHAKVNGAEVLVERAGDSRLQVPVSASEGKVEICFQSPWIWNAAGRSR